MFVCLFSFHWLPKPRLNIIDDKSYQIYLQQKALLICIVVQRCTQPKPFQNKHHNILKISIKFDLRNPIILPLSHLLSKYELALGFKKRIKLDLKFGRLYTITYLKICKKVYTQVVDFHRGKVLYFFKNIHVKYSVLSNAIPYSFRYDA